MTLNAYFLHFLLSLTLTDSILAISIVRYCIKLMKGLYKILRLLLTLYSVSAAVMMTVY